MTDLLDLLRTQPGASAPSRWLLGHLVAAGHLTESGLSRRARIRTCSCGQAVLAGLDDEILAFEVQVDPVPVSPIGEALALIEGRRTFSLAREGGRYVLDPRTAADILHHPAGTHPRRDVLRAHRCGTGELPEQLACATNFAEARPTASPDASPDF